MRRSYSDIPYVNRGVSQNTFRTANNFAQFSKETLQHGDSPIHTTVMTLDERKQRSQNPQNNDVSTDASMWQDRSHATKCIEQIDGKPDPSNACRQQHTARSILVNQSNGHWREKSGVSSCRNKI